MSAPLPQTTSDTPIHALVVGAGFAGLYMLHRLRQSGLSAAVVERAPDVGGTWFWNRYPGARCDVESLQYSYSWDEDLQQDWTWTERFATQPEILRYINHVAERFDLRRDITFDTAVTSATYDEAARQWCLTTDAGPELHCRYLITAVGCLSSANLPAIAGIDSYEGTTYRTSLWPHEGVDLTGQRVGLIGTGSSSIQAIPELASQAAELVVFQRTPNFSVPARNQPLTEEKIRYWKENYSDLRREARETTRSGAIYDLPVKSAIGTDPAEIRTELEARWEKGGANFAYAYNDLIVTQEANDIAAEFVRDKIRETVKDPATAEALCPKDYPIFAKRICVDSDYYETFNRDNVRLVDLRKMPIDRITPTGLKTSDAAFDFDVLIYATGFDAITGTLTRMNITGAGGRKLAEKWAEGPKAYLGLMTAGFPNLFMITGPGSPSVLSNMIVSIEQHVDFIHDLLVDLREKGQSSVDADPQAEEDWAAHVTEVAHTTLYPRAASWYMGANIPGKPRVFMPYIGVDRYRAKCDAIARAGYSGFHTAP